MEGEFCPLCGAHPFEHGEGQASDQEVLNWKENIEELYKRLKELEAT